MPCNVTPPACTRSLSTARAGESVQIRHILFDRLRSDCALIGLHEGDVVHCRSATPAQLVLEANDRKTVLLERDWARFIAIGRL
jgi:hypothetical protein